MHAFFVTAFCGSEKFNEITAKSTVKPSPASQTLNKSIVNGLVSNDVDVHSIVYLPCAPYPMSQVKRVRHETFFAGKKHTRTIIPFLNVQIVKQACVFLSVFRVLKNRLRLQENKKDSVIIADYLYLPICAAALLAGKLTNTKVIVIVPDIPGLMFQYMDKKDKLKKMLLVPYLKIMSAIVNSFDGYVVMAQEAMNELHVGQDKKYLVVEGIINAEFKTPDAERVKIRNCVMYTGGLYEQYGIMNLIQAMSLLDDSSVELWIYGSGELNDKVNEISRINPRIKYFGIVPNSEVLVAQKNARLLINPRIEKYAYTRYTFPSKILEYMISGRPVAMTKLDGIPDEYYDHVFTIEDSSSEGIARCINYALGQSEASLSVMANDAFDFIRKNKSEALQGKRLLTFCGEIAYLPEAR